MPLLRRRCSRFNSARGKLRDENRGRKTTERAARGRIAADRQSLRYVGSGAERCRGARQPWKPGWRDYANKTGDGGNYAAMTENAKKRKQSAIGKFFLRIGQVQASQPWQDEWTIPLFPLHLILDADGTLAK